mmetsp:Transcript_18306/g.40544  ORF Transcript_18306/g.40544 Transcript_18306/m.40544 type:complete len:112 (-) Transcript_18306:83-418(-)|eukprot:CAMPEP_0204271316 /NCGR_PEP_ID=MMETSP0468-20130131/19492_1 /ASSEMBLY_ACC=CAM_ASM_000383 /TAXON_ID=2969 /ORGANISM="Oxyrrhis marina" /LENGTH=111 /DNA_ID=CAMNT_0051246949 /DNA_START=112 /DNA_END=447 /DNA_ORIENTATION=+
MLPSASLVQQRPGCEAEAVPKLIVSTTCEALRELAALEMEEDAMVTLESALAAQLRELEDEQREVEMLLGRTKVSCSQPQTSSAVLLSDDEGDSSEEAFLKMAFDRVQSAP